MKHNKIAQVKSSSSISNWIDDIGDNIHFVYSKHIHYESAVPSTLTSYVLGTGSFHQRIEATREMSILKLSKNILENITDMHLTWRENHINWEVNIIHL
jgi:hypothetical protein